MFALMLVGCMAGPDSSLLPDDRLLIKLPESSETAKSVSKAEEKEWSEYYLLTADVTEDVNGMIGFVLGLTSAIVTWQRPTTYDAEAGYAEWGPYSETLDPVETVLWIQENEDGSLNWAYDQWPKDDTSARVSVIVGEVDAGSTKEDNTGRFTIDFTTMHELDPTTEFDQGLFAADYTLNPEGAAATVDFTDFTILSTDAAYEYTSTTAGDGTMGLLVNYDITPELGTGVNEDHSIFSRWAADGSGRGDATVTGGDLGSTTYHASECWNTSFERAYYTEDWSNITEGDLGACSFADTVYYE